MVSDSASGPAPGYLDTRRLRMVAANAQLISIDIEGRAALANALGVQVPDNWPPDLYDRTTMQFALDELGDPAVRGWSYWYLQLREPEGHELVGISGFKGRPDARGSVEISYSILSQFRRRGLATEAVSGLLGWAFRHPAVAQVTAETFPWLEQSLGVLRNCGFTFEGQGSEPGVVRYSVNRSMLR